MGSPIVQISDGKIKGTSMTNINGETFHAFLSVPFGKPPLGDLRFKAPQPIEPWEGIKEVTKQGEANIQLNLFQNKIEGSEDCLNLHVFTKKLPEEEKELKPVLVYIHGGGFMMGSHDININGPEYLMTKDVVLVCITYRLGLLGFLSLQDPSLEVPGNAGLKDQVLGLKWVQNNIKKFNGDPNNITIFGISAGAVSVEYLVLSPTAKGLFHKGIAISGSTLNPWSRCTYFDPIDFGKSLGHQNINEEELLKLLRDMDATELYQAQTKYQSENSGQLFGLITPVVEKPNPTAFITKRPMDIIQSGEYNKMPLIFGFTEKEWLLFETMEKMREKMGQPIAKKDPTLKFLLPSDTNFEDVECVKKMVHKLKEFYNEENTVEMMSDGMFVAGILTSAINHAKVSKHSVYLYKFAFSGDLNISKNMAPQSDISVASHGDEMGYLFKNMLSTKPPGQSEKLTIQRLVTMWTNFAIFANPTPEENDLNVEWKPIEGKNVHFLEIGQELVPGINPKQENLKLWKNIFQMNPTTAKYL